jgi:serine/threonine-protein kinase
MRDPQLARPPVESLSSSQFQDIRSRFEAAWKETLRGGQQPTIEMFLKDTREPERSLFHQELEKVAKTFHDRMTSDPVTIDLSGAIPPSSESAVNGDTQLVGADGELPATQTDVEFSLAPEAGSMTIDYSPTRAKAAEDLNSRLISGPAAPPTGKLGAFPRVAGYELLAELGRGGMGVVYKARQKGLNRLVALKMVLAGGHAGPEHLARFQIEAEAVARLKHPYIVQIYEVGERDGLPFFSLELVDGGSLARLIDGEPQPPRKAAEMLSKLAHGVHYAHQNGIVHRDLKPANILLTSDGTPKITDFGLAKRLEEGGQSQTQSGTLMGTPNYMAPEQARGDVHQIGPGADVYALGGLLYEMLTGRPPFLGSTMLETLEQVRSKEPVPPSHLIPRTPRDLETICLKCLQKEPHKRYLSSGDLAEDLDRFVAGEPILARPVGSLERAWRWCRRNPRVAALAATVLVLLIAGTAISTTAAITIADERNQKEEERQAAEAARLLAVQRKAEADEANDQAQKNALQARDQSRLALRSFGTLIDEVQRQIGDNPGMQTLKGKLLETALDGLDRVAKSDEDSRLLGQSMAAAYMKMGQLFQQMGQSEKAFLQYQKCHEIIQALAAKNPEGDVAQANLAATYTMLGEMSLELRRDMRASLDYYQKALDLRKELTKRTQSEKRPAVGVAGIGGLLATERYILKVKQEFAESHTRIGVTFLRLGEPPKAQEYFLEAHRLREGLAKAAPENLSALLDVARSHNALGEVRFRLRDWPKAREEFAKALALCEKAVNAEPKNPRYQFELANTLGNSGVFDVRTGTHTAARSHYERYLALMQQLADLDPKNAVYERYLGLANYRFGTLARKLGDGPMAERCNRKCLEIREKLAKADTISERRKIELLLILPRCGQHVRAAEEAVKVRAGSPDREVLVEVAQCLSQCAAAVPGDLDLQKRYTESALDALRQAVSQGFTDLVILETEPDLDPLREAPGFQSLLGSLRSGNGTLKR